MPTKKPKSRMRTTKVGNCDACGKRIGGAFVAFICKLHSICFGCTRTMSGLIPDWARKEGACPYCKMEGAAYIEETEFHTTFPTTTPQTIKHSQDLQLPRIPWCGWSTVYDDIIAVGRNEAAVGMERQPATVDIVNINGQVVSHTLPEGGKVMSGIYLDQEKCLVCVMHPFSVFTCNIHPKDSTPSHPDVLKSLPVQNPNNVFPMEKNRYGIFCHEPPRIEVFSKKALYIEESPKSEKTITLRLQMPHEWDRACATPNGRICLSSCNHHKMFIYDNTGVLIKSVGEPGELESNVPGVISVPRSITTTQDGTVVLTDLYGDVQTYRQGKGWATVKAKDGEFTCALVLSDTRVWLVRTAVKVSVYSMVPLKE